MKVFENGGRNEVLRRLKNLGEKFIKGMFVKFNQTPPDDSSDRFFAMQV